MKRKTKILKVRGRAICLTTWPSVKNNSRPIKSSEGPNCHPERSLIHESVSELKVQGTDCVNSDISHFYFQIN